jgi:hypothetical protein
VFRIFEDLIIEIQWFIDGRDQVAFGVFAWSFWIRFQFPPLAHIGAMMDTQRSKSWQEEELRPVTVIYCPSAIAIRLSQDAGII